MEYIPDGLTKSQWEQIKKKEAEELKAKVHYNPNRYLSHHLDATDAFVVGICRVIWEYWACSALRAGHSKLGRRPEQNIYSP